MSKAQLIVALDVDTIEEARGLIDDLGDSVEIYKVGHQQWTNEDIISYLQLRGKKIFLDLKYYDIPNTVASAVKSAIKRAVFLSKSPNDDPRFAPIFMLTVHISGGKEMLEVVVKAAKEHAEALNVDRPYIVGVTVLTSITKDVGTQELVLRRARLAKESGLDGVVASVEETAFIRRECGPDFLIVTPGIRPADASLNDQKRAATPQAAILQGSNFLVVGRPIIQASSPREAALRILEEMKNR